VKDLVEKVQDSLNGNAQLRPFKIKANLCDQGGCVVLTGTVPTYYLKQIAQTAALKIMEGREGALIQNRVQVAEPVCVK